MNTHFRSPTLPRTTQAAEGLMRRRWSVAEIEAMVEAGVILEDERFELIGGEAVPMSPKGNRHELLKGALNLFWGKRCPESFRFVPKTTFRLDEDTFLEPDFVFYRIADGLVNLKPENALLAVEIADSSLGYDLGRKALLYSNFAIRELWVIDAVKLETHIHRRPGREGYEDKTVVASDQTLTPGFAPELAVRLAELQLV
jgi:Uma2 family endonuclease